MQERTELIRKNCKIISDTQYYQLDVGERKEIDKLIQHRIGQMEATGRLGIGGMVFKRQEKTLEVLHVLIHTEAVSATQLCFFSLMSKSKNLSGLQRFVSPTDKIEAWQYSLKAK